MRGAEQSSSLASLDVLLSHHSQVVYQSVTEFFGIDIERTGYHSRIIFLEIQAFALVFKVSDFIPSFLQAAGLYVLSGLSLHEH